jgi:hypothetical protein
VFLDPLIESTGNKQAVQYTPAYPEQGKGGHQFAGIAGNESLPVCVVNCKL